LKPIIIGKSDDGKLVALDVPRLIASRLLVTASSGGGKSWLLRKILEEVSASTQTIVIDVEGEYASLREIRDMLLVGADGDLPAAPETAALLARRIMEKNVSAVIDIYELPPAKRREFVAEFCGALVNMPKDLWRRCIIAIDETHEFAPNTKDKEYASGEQVGLLLSKGRKRGYCPILATQRLSKLSMDVAAECKTRFIGNTVLDVDQRRAADFLGWGKERWTDLRDLSPPGHEGEFFAVGPALTDRGIVKFRAGQVRTSHPKAGEGAMPEPPQPSKKIAAVLQELTDLPHQAEEELKTVRQLKAKIGELQQQLRSRPRELVEKVREKRVEVPVLREGDIKRLEAVAEKFTAVGNVARATADSITSDLQASRRQVPVPAVGPVRSTSTPLVSQHQTPKTPSKPVISAPSSAATDEISLKAGAYRMLQILVQQRDQTLSLDQLGTLSGFAPSGGTFKEYVRSLTRQQLARELPGDLLEPTQAGIDHVGSDVPRAPSTTEGRVEMWARQLKAGAAVMLRILVRVGHLPKDVLGKESGFESSGGTFKEYLRALTRNGLATVDGDIVKISDSFFI
jgi:hypothetical protein